ncbi:MAG: bifunctional riboflavin kinase/FAD synthetase [Tenericutes bacterium]|nr:bifunctional riboflavin kinase/FAD synthetase [Mycoplasmatota bacterium]
MVEIKYLEYKDFILEKNLVLCLGFFDGLHIAHTKLIEEAKKIAKAKELPLAVFTFSMSVKDYLRKDRHRCLTTIEDKALLCEKLAVDYLYVMKVSDHLIHMSAKEFMSRYLDDTDTVVIGFDFAFGYKGEGDRNTLKRNKNFDTIVIPKMDYLDLKVGTTRIKANLADANLELAEHLLGRPYSVKGRVVSGRGIGKRLGYPTANIDYTPYFLPKSGVYRTKIIYKCKSYFGLTNIGNKPTYFHLPLTVETYVFQINESMYNHTIEVIFLEYIRAEKKFNNETELTEQIFKDISYVEAKIKEENHE